MREGSRKIRCPKCRQLYEFWGTPAEVSYCPECLITEGEIAEKVKDFVAANANASVSDVAMEFEITLAKVKNYLKLDYLEIKGNSHNFLLCEKCSRPVNSGKYCGACDFEINTKKASLMKAHLKHRS